MSLNDLSTDWGKVNILNGNAPNGSFYTYYRNQSQGTYGMYFGYLAYGDNNLWEEPIGVARNMFTREGKEALGKGVILFPDEAAEVKVYDQPLFLKVSKQVDLEKPGMTLVKVTFIKGDDILSGKGINAWIKRPIAEEAIQSARVIADSLKGRIDLKERPDDYWSLPELATKAAVKGASSAISFEEIGKEWKRLMHDSPSGRRMHSYSILSFEEDKNQNEPLKVTIPTDEWISDWHNVEYGITVNPDKITTFAELKEAIDNVGIAYKLKEKMLETLSLLVEKIVMEQTKIGTKIDEDKSSSALTDDTLGTGGIDLVAVKIKIEDARFLTDEQRKANISTLKTLYASSALFDMGFAALACLYVEEIKRMVRDGIIKEIVQEDRNQLITVFSALQKQGYLNDAQSQEFLNILSTGKPVTDMKFVYLENPGYAIRP